MCELCLDSKVLSHTHTQANNPAKFITHTCALQNLCPFSLLQTHLEMHPDPNKGVRHMHGYCTRTPPYLTHIINPSPLTVSLPAAAAYSKQTHLFPEATVGSLTTDIHTRLLACQTTLCPPPSPRHLHPTSSIHPLAQLSPALKAYGPMGWYVPHDNPALYRPDMCRSLHADLHAAAELPSL